MKRAALAGARITHGPSDWQIIQRRLDNTADIAVGGTWLDPGERMATVEIRLVSEDNAVPAAPHLDWSPADTSPDRTWRHVLENIPAGGPYRLETRLHLANDSWRLTGDSVRHLGVGDLWIIAGDDNAVGFGHGMAHDPVQFGVHQFRKSERWSLASHPLHDNTGIRNAKHFSSGNGSHSPWLAFGKEIRRRTGLPIGLIPAAREGSLLENWHPRRTGQTASAFLAMTDLVRTATSMYDFATFSLLDGGPRFLPKPEHPPGVVAGMLWFHGNADCRREGSAKAYGKSLREFIASVRNAFEAPQLPVVVCQSNRVIGTANPGESQLWGLVREAQRAAAADLPHVAVVPTLDAGLSDGIHLSTAGNLLVGERVAQAAMGLVYGGVSPWQCPDFHDAWFHENDRSTVVVEFKNVSGELRPVSGEITSLLLADETGGAPIRKVRLEPPARLVAVTNRPLQDKPVVSFCSGHNPALAFVDDGNRPPLAFANIAIRED